MQTICFVSQRWGEKTNQNTPSPYTFDLSVWYYTTPFSPKCEQFRIYLDFSMPNRRIKHNRNEQEISFFPSFKMFAFRIGFCLSFFSSSILSLELLSVFTYVWLLLERKMLACSVFSVQGSVLITNTMK